MIYLSGRVKAEQIGARPEVCLINGEELARIRELIAANTWPDRWSGDEQRADEYVDRVLQDGSIQPVLMWE